MVNLMLQPVFLNLVKGSTDHKMTSDDLYNMWSVASRAKSAIVQGGRLENLSWRLWYTSTIRSKIEMEEKRRSCSLDEGDDLLDDDAEKSDFVDTETDTNTSTSSSSNNRKKKKETVLVLPSDRPLFTSTCTSILAEIQDASFRTTAFNNNNSHNNNFSSHFHSTSHTCQSSHNSHNSHVNIVSPPTNRSKSPGNSFNQTNFRRKKNVEKFLKKFKSNLEDISEQFDDKLILSGDEETQEAEAVEGTEVADHNIKDNTQTEVSLKSLSPTASSNHFATDEEGQYSSFYVRNEDNLINMLSSENSKKKNQPSMISKLLRKEESDGSSDSSENNNDGSPSSQTANCNRNRNRIVHVNTNNTRPNFIFNSNSESFINDQLELMATNRYNKMIERNDLKSPIPPQPRLQLSNEKRVIDANALSTSLSASKFKLEDEFDSQLVIW